MKLLLLRCPQCNQALAPGQADQVVQCPNCRQAVALLEGGFVVLAARYARPSAAQPPEWLPFWVYRGNVTIRERKTQGTLSVTRFAEDFWGQTRRIFIPAWAGELAESRDLVEMLLEKQPALEESAPPEGVAFRSAVVTPEDARKLLDLVIISIEAKRIDAMERLDFDVTLDEESFWLLPAERKRNEWRLLVKGI